MKAKEELNPHEVTDPKIKVGTVLKDDLCSKVDKSRYTLLIYVEKPVDDEDNKLSDRYAILDYDCKVRGIYERPGNDSTSPSIGPTEWLPHSLDFQHLSINDRKGKPNADFKFKYTNGIYESGKHDCGCKDPKTTDRDGHKWQYVGCTCDFAKDGEIELKYIAGTPQPSIKCNGLNNTYWVDRNILKNTGEKFCKEAEKQGKPDEKGGDSLKRSYKDSGLEFSIYWPANPSFKPKYKGCVKNIGLLTDSCDGDAQKNPLNWKHGGNSTVAGITYHVTPTKDRGYVPGKCYMYLKEKDKFSGINSPGFAMSHIFSVQIEASDSNYKVFAGTKGKQVPCGANNPFIFEAYYADFEITPEAQGDYIRFTLGNQSWKSTKDSGNPHCIQGKWNIDTSPHYRDVYCYFDC